MMIMTLKTLSRLSTFPLIVALAFAAQKASCLPFWDSATNYPVPSGSPFYVNLVNLINPEGNAWGQVGSIPQPYDIEVVNYPLTYPGLECSASNSFFFGNTGGNTGYSERIAIHPPMLAGPTLTYLNVTNQITDGYVMSLGTTIYYSFIFQIPTLASLTTGGGFICGFNNLVGPQSGTISVANARLYFELPSNGSTNYKIGIGANTSAASGATFATNLFNMTSTNFVVCSYTPLPIITSVVGGVTNFVTNNYAQMWINPDPSTFGAAVPPAPSATNNNNAGGVGGGVAENQVMSFYWRQGNIAIPEVYAADLRIGYCWACMTPPSNNPAPQAATLSIAAASSNLAVVSFPTNTPCYLMQSSTNVVYASNTWPIVTTAPTLVGTKFVVTNTVAAITTVTSNVVGNVTNKTTNTFLPPTYYQAKTFAN
jgi:hypothetical protein